MEDFGEGRVGPPGTSTGVVYYLVDHPVTRGVTRFPELVSEFVTVSLVLGATFGRVRNLSSSGHKCRSQSAKIDTPDSGQGVGETRSHGRDVIIVLGKRCRYHVYVGYFAYFEARVADLMQSCVIHQ